MRRGPDRGSGRLSGTAGKEPGHSAARKPQGGDSVPLKSSRGGGGASHPVSEERTGSFNRKGLGHSVPALVLFVFQQTHVLPLN